MIALLVRPLALLLVLAVAACAVGPTYQRPSAPVSPTYKEAQGWVQATPGDTLPRGPWWTMFQDSVLDSLAARVAVSNQNVAAAIAAYDQARAFVREQRASLFPVVTLDGGASRARTGTGTRNNFQVSIGGSWEPDVWGRLRQTVSAASASAEASAADLASATLSAQGELVTDYVNLRESDVAMALLRTSIEGYQRSLQITQNRYQQGIIPRTDVLQAQTQLANAQADLTDLARQRAQLEHAIAVLIGEAPGNFGIEPVADWHPIVPDVPIGVPSTLLERRPDIASAERRVAAANEQIGVARTAFFPNFTLNGSGGTGASRIPELFNASSLLWSLGASAVQTLFDAGARSARVAESRAAYEQAVARYRETVLTAFQNVEDQLAATRVLAEEEAFRREASQAADLVEAQVLNRYRAGIVNYTEVVTAQVTALNARRALASLAANRQTVAVALIQALGGGWTSDLVASVPVKATANP